MSMMRTISGLRRFQTKPSFTMPPFSSSLRYCSGSGEKGENTVDRFSETKGAMNSYLKSTQSRSSSGSAKAWEKNLKPQDQNQGHVQYFAADDPKAKAKAKGTTDDDNMSGLGGAGSDDSYSLDDADDYGGKKGRKSRRRRGGDDDDEDKALDKQRQDKDDADPKRGISPTVSTALHCLALPLVHLFSLGSDVCLLLPITVTVITFVLFFLLDVIS
jgi:hypothetical protein